MKIKYYLRGLGTGILITTLILFVAYSYKDTKEKNEEKGTSGKVVEQNESSSTKDKETQETKETSKTSESTTPQESSSREENTTEEPTTEEPTTEEPTTEEPTTAPIVDNTVTTVEFTIYSGYTSYDVANLLEQMGVVESAAEFDSYLAENGYDWRISTGVYTVTVGDSYETIAEMITN